MINNAFELLICYNRDLYMTIKKILEDLIVCYDSIIDKTADLKIKVMKFYYFLRHITF